MSKRTYVALNNDGDAIGIVEAASESEAESFALRKLPGFIGCLEARSANTKDVDAVLTQLYRKAGMSETDTRLKVLARNSDIRSYDLEELRKAQTFASGSSGGRQPTNEDVDAILREAGLLPQRRDKKQSQGQSTSKKTTAETGSTDEARLESAFKGLGMNDKTAKTAARGRR